MGIPLREITMYRFIKTVLFIALLCLLPVESLADSQSNDTLNNIESETPDNRIVSSLSVQVYNNPGKPAKLESMARKLIFLREGETYSSQKLASSISTLQVCNKFKTITVDSVVNADGIALTFNLEPYLVIRKIIVMRGYFPLFESDILKAMTVRSGSVYSEDILEKQKELIENLYKREGYSNAVAKIDVEEYPDNGYADLRILTEKGSPVLLKAIRFNGNKEYAEWRLKLRMRTWRRRLIPFNPRRFIEKIIAEDVKRLTAFYRKGRTRRSYPECVIKYDIEMDEDQRRLADIGLSPQGIGRIGLTGLFEHALLGMPDRVREVLAGPEGFFTGVKGVWTTF